MIKIKSMYTFILVNINDLLNLIVLTCCIEEPLQVIDKLILILVCVSMLGAKSADVTLSAGTPREVCLVTSSSRYL